MERASSAPASRTAGDVPVAWGLGDGASGLSATPGLKGYLSAGLIESVAVERGQGRPGRLGGATEHLVPAMNHSSAHNAPLQHPPGRQEGPWLRSTSPPRELARLVSALGMRPECLVPGPWSGKGGGAGRPWAAAEEGVFLGRDKHRFGPGGHTWRKYGHKTLSGTCVKRYYYACTERDSRGCPARKVVDRKASAAKGDSSGDIVNIEGTHNHAAPSTSSKDHHDHSSQHPQETQRGPQRHTVTPNAGLTLDRLQCQGSAVLDAFGEGPESQKLARLWQMLLSQTSKEAPSNPVRPSTGSSSLGQSVGWNSLFQSASPPRSANPEGTKAPLRCGSQSLSGSPRLPDSSMPMSALSLKGEWAEQMQGALASALRVDSLPSAGLSQVALQQHSTPPAWAASPFSSPHTPEAHPGDAKWIESLQGSGSRKRSLQGQAVLAAAALRDQSADAAWLQEELVQIPGAESASSGSAVSLRPGDATATDPMQTVPLHGQPGTFLAKLAKHAQDTSRSASPASTSAAQDCTSLGQQGGSRCEAGKASTAASSIPKPWARASGFAKLLEPSRLGQDLQTQSRRVSSVRQRHEEDEWGPGGALPRSLPGGEPAWAGAKRRLSMGGSSATSMSGPTSIALVPPSSRSEQTSLLSTINQLADPPPHLSGTHSAPLVSTACWDLADALGSSSAAPGQFLSGGKQAGSAGLEVSWMLPLMGSAGASQSCLQVSSADSRVGRPLAESRPKRRKWVESQVGWGIGANTMAPGIGAKPVLELAGQEVSWANVRFGDSLNGAPNIAPSRAPPVDEEAGPKMHQLPLLAQTCEAIRRAAGPGSATIGAIGQGYSSTHRLAALPTRVRKTEQLAVVQSSSASSAEAALKMRSLLPHAHSGMERAMDPSQSGLRMGSAACTAPSATRALEGLHGLTDEAQGRIDGVCALNGDSAAISTGPAALLCNVGSKLHSESTETEGNEESKAEDFFTGLLDCLRM